VSGVRAVWIGVIAAAVAVRAWNALLGPLTWGYDAWGHVAYTIFLDLYRAVPWADQGWSYFHPPLHYAVGWALAQFGNGELLVRGLAVWGGLASLSTSGCAAYLANRITPERPDLVMGAFAAVAFLPAHLFMSPMPGNEMTLTALTSLTLAVLVAFGSRSGRGLWGDVALGVLLGLALLTKFTGLIALGVVIASIGVWTALAERPDWRRAVARAARIGVLALLVCAPYYARNLQTFGTPFQLSRDFALVRSVEGGQPPGSRHWTDYLRFSPRMFSDPNPLQPHLLGSVFGTVYLNVWADVFRESDVERALVAEESGLQSTTAMAVAGLFPTALVLFGVGCMARDVARGRRRAVYVPVGLLAGASVAAFVFFTWQVPIWSALKSSYLLGLSLPFALGLVRALEALGSRSRAVARVCTGALALVWTAAAWVSLEGVGAPLRADAPATGALHYYFEEYDRARRVYGRLIEGAGYKVPWLENLAAVDLADGQPQRARILYARAVEMAMQPDAQRAGRLAVATALSGDHESARAQFDRAIAQRPLPELFANRAALILDSDAQVAESDLRVALAAVPELVPAWLHLAELLAESGRSDEARGARRRATEQACAGPRGYPYGVGTGEVLEWGVGRRMLLVRDSGELRAALPRWHRTACSRLAGGGG
jgi:tetratricopeptide (TPR) repeat protein